MKTARTLSLGFATAFALTALAFAADLPPKLKPFDLNGDGKADLTCIGATRLKWYERQ